MCWSPMTYIEFSVICTVYKLSTIRGHRRLHLLLLLPERWRAWYVCQWLVCLAVIHFGPDIGHSLIQFSITPLTSIGTKNNCDYDSQRLVRVNLFVRMALHSARSHPLQLGQMLKKSYQNDWFVVWSLEIAILYLLIDEITYHQISWSLEKLRD